MFEQDYLELYELQQIIREGVEDAVPGPVRVKAEIASMQQRANGHCYMELSQSGISGPVAKVRAVIWRSQVLPVLGKFSEATGAPLQPGVSVIFEVRVNYSELYGLTLVIEDVDVEHVLGEAELRRRQTLERLEKEGLTELQKELALPDVPYRLAVISAEDAAGYGDFRRHLLENEYGFAFDVVLFPATMQGDGAPASIVAALNRIFPSAPDCLRPSALLNRSGGFGGSAPRSLGVQGDDSIDEVQRSDAGGFGGSAPRPLGVQGDDSIDEVQRSDAGGSGGSAPRPLGVQGDDSIDEVQRSDAGGFGGSAPRPLGVQGDDSLPRRGRRREATGFDAVLILRGGGSTLDLACFDDYELCAAIARFPIPVFTAIGHDRDNHIADIVACGSVKTPTALADLFIDTVAAEDQRITDYRNRLRIAFANKATAQELAADKLYRRIVFALGHVVTLADTSLSKLETRIAAANPRGLLERGYSLITDERGALLKRAADAAAGDRIRVLFPDGTLNCTVNGKI